MPAKKNKKVIAPAIFNGGVDDGEVQETQASAAGTGAKAEGKNEKLLREIREDYDYFLDYWREIRQEGQIDLRFVAGDPWDPTARAERENFNRPVVCPDECGQYLNQAINNLRQNKRAIKVNPKGSGATDEDADRRGNIIRGVEYKSNAQAAYTTGFEGSVNNSFGAWRLTTEVVNRETGEVEPRIKRIPNPFTVLFDPDAKEADRSDQERCFVTDTIRLATFSSKYPNAQKKSFASEDTTLAPNWFSGKNIVVAEYWRRYKDDKLKNGYRVVQYITNGLEILEEHEWDGSWIPIIGVFGKEIYLNTGGGAKLVMQSMVRLARDPQMMLAYIASQEAEEFGMMPRAPVQGVVGQFETDKEAWDNLNKQPRPYVQYDAVVDSVTGQTLPPPSRPQFEPNAAAYEMSRESWRRSIQAAMGIMPLPTDAQRQNQKSGVALTKIQTQSSVGSFHFTDNFDRAIENTGRQLNELISVVLDTPRHVPVRKRDESHSLMFVTSQKYADQVPKDEEDVLITDKGEYEVTISTGPSFQSQREEAMSFVDMLLPNLQQIPPPGSPPAKILAKAIRLKTLGPIGDEIADLLDPKQDGEEIPPQAQAMIQQAQQQNQALNAYLQQIEAKAKQLEDEKQSKLLDNQYKAEIEKMRIDSQTTIELAKLENQRAIAEITTKAQDARERARLDADLDEKERVRAHEVGMAAAGKSHEVNMAAQQHDQALEQQDAAGAQQAALAQQQPAQ